MKQKTTKETIPSYLKRYQGTIVKGKPPSIDGSNPQAYELPQGEIRNIMKNRSGAYCGE